MPDEKKKKPIMDSMHHKMGVCPSCSGDQLVYECISDTSGGEMVSYSYICDDCHFDGKEWYSLTFVAHTQE